MKYKTNQLVKYKDCTTNIKGVVLCSNKGKTKQNYIIKYKGELISAKETELCPLQMNNP